MNARIMILALPAILLPGCGTAPSARDSANFGVTAIGEMQSALSDFQANERFAAEARQDSLKEQHDAARSALADVKFFAMTRDSAGDLSTQVIANRLEANADAYAAGKAAAKAQDTAQAKAISALVTPLPSTTASTAEAQKSLAALAADLPVSIQLKETRDLYREVKASADENRKKVAAARKAAAEVAAKP